MVRRKAYSVRRNEQINAYQSTVLSFAPTLAVQYNRIDKGGVDLLGPIKGMFKVAKKGSSKLKSAGKKLLAAGEGVLRAAGFATVSAAIL